MKKSELVKRLKESNIFVIGAGEKKTAPSFVKACDRFFYLDELSDNKELPIEKVIKEKKKKKKTSKAEEARLAKELLKEEVENFAIKIFNKPCCIQQSKFKHKIKRSKKEKRPN